LGTGRGQRHLGASRRRVWRAGAPHMRLPMHITMIKKRLASGEPCAKCRQTEDMLMRRGLWDRIDEVVWAVEGDADSAGMVLARAHGVTTAPFFVVRDEDGRDS